MVTIERVDFCGVSGSFGRRNIGLVDLFDRKFIKIHSNLIRNLILVYI